MNGPHRRSKRGEEIATEQVVSCRTCGLLQWVDPVPRRGVAKCARCGFALHYRKPDSRKRTLALALGAFILYFPANLFPIVTTQYWGAEQKTTIFNGIQGLFRQGSYLVGCLVFTTSILTPALKILGLLLLSLTLPWRGWQTFRTWTYKIIQIVDPWNMLEVTLLAILVSIAELNEAATRR